MKKQTGPSVVSAAELQLLEQLREHPEIGTRVRHILELASSGEGPLKTADEMEALLVAELRLLGGDTMSQWARQAEARVSHELKAQDPTVRSRKKKR